MGQVSPGGKLPGSPSPGGAGLIGNPFYNQTSLLSQPSPIIDRDMDDPAASGEGDLPDEPYGNVWLKRSSKAATGYVGVYKSAGKKRPFQAQIKNKRNGKSQSLGTFETAQLAAAAVANALAVGDDKDMDSPRKQAHRGEWLRTHAPNFSHAPRSCSVSDRLRRKCEDQGEACCVACSRTRCGREPVHAAGCCGSHARAGDALLPPKGGFGGNA